MQHVLSEKKAKWNSSQVYRYHYDGEESSEHSQFPTMRQIAFTMHAAELFSQCCKFNAVKCMEFLLDKAPQLTHMKATSGHNRLALNTALLYSSPITKVLLRKDAVIGKADSASTLAAIYMRQRCYYNDIQQATELLCQGNEDVISQFECIFSPGETLLHLLYDSFDIDKRPLPKLDDTVFCTKLLLKSGVDPTKKAFKGTALDILMDRLIKYRSVLGRAWNDVETRKYALAAQTFSACVQILLPVFQGKPLGDYDLPPSLIDFTKVSHESICMEFIKLLQLVIDNGVYYDMTPVRKLRMCLNFPKPNPCSFCAPAVRLLFTCLCYQPNRSSENEFLEEFMNSSQSIFMTLFVLQDVCHAADGQQCVLHECCSWEMLELMVQAGAMRAIHDLGNINPNIMMSEKLTFMKSQYSDHFRNGCPTILQRFARVVKMGWIHCTSKADRNDLEMFVEDLAHNETTDYARIVAEELRDFMQNALPLKTLTRLCIMQHVMWKDVKHLPLPTALKVYVRLGELSVDHPVRSMSEAQLAA